MEEVKAAEDAAKQALSYYGALLVLRGSRDIKTATPSNLLQILGNDRSLVAMMHRAYYRLEDELNLK